MSPQYDITWSFTYELSNQTDGDEIGYCMFLQDASMPLSGGGVGPDLGFSGNTASVASLSTQPMNGAILGVGFDSLGIFASELTYDVGNNPRPGNATIVPNSITVRDDNFDVITTQAISAFDIISPGKKTIRTRLGNYGRSISVDYKSGTDTFFTPILNQTLTGIDVSSSARYRPGVSFVKPLISSNTNGVIITTGFHVEGNQDDVNESELEFNPLTAFTVDNTATGPDPQIAPTEEATPRLPFLGMGPDIGCPDGSCGATFTGATIDNSFFPNTVLYQISSFMGEVELEWSTPGAPYRFIFKYDDVDQVDTGFIGNAEYNYEGVSRDTFITGMLSSAQHGSYPAIDLAPDGYPYVISTSLDSLSTFYKDSDTSRLEVEVYAPLSSIDWEVVVGCPFHTLSCGIEDSWVCGYTQKYETTRKIVFTNYSPTLDPRYTTLDYDVEEGPDRFIVT